MAVKKSDEYVKDENMLAAYIEKAECPFGMEIGYNKVLTPFYPTPDRIIAIHDFDEETLKYALFNSEKLNPAVLCMWGSNYENDCINFKFLPADELYILTTKAELYGAVALFYPNVRKHIYLRIGKYIAVVFGTDEVLIIPEKLGIGEDEFDKMFALEKLIWGQAEKHINIYRYDGELSFSGAV